MPLPRRTCTVCLTAQVRVRRRWINVRDSPLPVVLHRHRWTSPEPAPAAPR